MISKRMKMTKNLKKIILSKYLSFQFVQNVEKNLLLISMIIKLDYMTVKICIILIIYLSLNIKKHKL